MKTRKSNYRHPDGLVQFSGQGVFSGRNEDGSVRGMGVLSSPLHGIFDGPSFNYAIQNIDDLDALETVPANSLVLDVAEYCPIEITSSLTVEAHYFTPEWRRFIRLDSVGHPIISVSHPCGAVLELKVFAAPTGCDFPGFLGFELYRLQLGFADNGYSFGGPAERMRVGDNGHRVADALFCVYPQPECFQADRSLNYPQRPVT